MPKFYLSPPTLAALSAAILFGGSTPFAKQLVGDISPLLLAGLLYLGSGLGLRVAWKNLQKWPVFNLPLKLLGFA